MVNQLLASASGVGTHMHSSRPHPDLPPPPPPPPPPHIKSQFAVQGTSFRNSAWGRTCTRPVLIQTCLPPLLLLLRERALVAEQYDGVAHLHEPESVACPQRLRLMGCETLGHLGQDEPASE